MFRLAMNPFGRLFKKELRRAGINLPLLPKEQTWRCRCSRPGRLCLRSGWAVKEAA